MALTNRRSATPLLAALTIAGLVGCRTDIATEPDTSDSLVTRVETLDVATSDAARYDRDRFGDYDRDAILARNRSAHPGCIGYYSRVDDECHDSADAVHIDHRVALAEAWRSGAADWTRERRDEFAADPDNLVVMTDRVNMSKSDNDPADWLPPHTPARCGYIREYVQVKERYDLDADRAEKLALLETAQSCDATPTEEES